MIRPPRSRVATPGRIAAAALIAAALVVSGCSTSMAPSATTASSAAAPGTVTVSIDPLGNDLDGAVTAQFGTAQPGRRVALQRQADSGWEKVAEAQEDASGLATFKAPSGKYAYRVVAAASDGAPEVTSATIGVDQQWKPKMVDTFDGSTLDAKYWAPRLTGVYIASRKCSTPSVAMSTLKGGSLALSVAKSSPKQAAAARKAAVGLGAPAADPCPDGAYDNAMVASEGKFSFRYGLVAVRLKMPPEQGQHGSAWLQSTDGSGAEIDFIESFGLGKGVQYKLHNFDASGKLTSTGGYIKSIPAVKQASWWDEYHTVVLEWSQSEYVITIDGQEVVRTSKNVSQTDKFLILSLLTSDWELPRLDPSQLPSTMKVDWIGVWQK